MTSRLASRPAPRPRSLGRRRRSSRITSRRRAICARRSRLSLPLSPVGVRKQNACGQGMSMRERLVEVRELGT